MFFDNEGPHLDLSTVMDKYIWRLLWWKNRSQDIFHLLNLRLWRDKSEAVQLFSFWDPFVRDQGKVLKVIGSSVFDKIICLLLNSMGNFSCSHFPKSKFGNL